MNNGKPVTFAVPRPIFPPLPPSGRTEEDMQTEIDILRRIIRTAECCQPCTVCGNPTLEDQEDRACEECDVILPCYEWCGRRREEAEIDCDHCGKRLCNQCANECESCNGEFCDDCYGRQRLNSDVCMSCDRVIETSGSSKKRPLVILDDV